MKTLAKRIFWMFFILPLIIGLLVANADALQLDLTAPGSSGTINGTIFITPPTVTSGTGLIDSFLRIQASNQPTEAGYNTDGTVEFDTKDGGGFTHSLQLSAIQTNIVDIGGTNYYEFVLDVNETPGNSLITLHDLEFYLDPAPDNSGYPAIGTLVYNFDVGLDGDSSVIIDYINYQGSGKLDLFALVPTSYFGTDLTQYVYLYSMFGEPDGTVDDGFEEWAHKEEGTFTPPDPIPEPATALLFITGIMGLFGMGIKRKS
jgi:hypothetical protein